MSGGGGPGGGGGGAREGGGGAGPIYLDYNGTTPHDPRVVAAMRPFLEEHFGNPSSDTAYGRRARAGLEAARSGVAGLIGADPGEVVFTSGGTESNNWALRGVAEALREKGDHIVTTQVEHPAVTEVCHHLAAGGCTVTAVGVDRCGRADPEEVGAALTGRTVLVSVMHANNEVGTVQPVAEIARRARERGILVHTDAAQSAGKIPVDVEALGVDLLTLAGHKLYAPKGIGALYVRRGTPLARFIHGAGQEGGRRAGTENVLLAAGLGAACAIAAGALGGDGPPDATLRDRLHARLDELCAGGLHLNGHPQERLPNTLSLGVEGVDANALLAAVADRVAASAGAACHSGGTAISAVLRAMKVPDDLARGTVRLSTGRMTTVGEIDAAAEIIGEAVGRLRARSGKPGG